MPDVLHYFVRFADLKDRGITLGPFLGRIELASDEIRIGLRRTTIARYYEADYDPAHWVILPEFRPREVEHCRPFFRATLWAEVAEPGASAL